MPGYKYMLTPRRTPSRTCFVCGSKIPKIDLTRISKITTKHAIVNICGQGDGRGAYICHNNECRNKASTGTKLEKALKVSITSEQKKTIQNYFIANPGNG